ncbi:metallophosphoesterase [Psychroserpens damuponensis]|uniref:metallophosphoesterase n=1 Tax=Psychroserpens damuponensis TaxID=943936 RepID=UPI00058B3116|nr:metallophosphoesterase [Psychroserpens damuponensis]
MPKFSRRIFIKRVSLAITALLVIDAFWFEKYIIDWNYFDISKGTEPKIKTIQISDLHIEKLKSFHISIAEKINALKPDLIFITGDAVNTTEDIEILYSFLKLIDKTILKYAILGNWEYWGKVDVAQLKTMYAKTNCELLINENRTVTLKNRQISIIGLDDLIGGTPNYNIAKTHLETSNTNIVLSHCPQYRDTIAKLDEDAQIDLILSGHTHGGQIAFLGYAPVTPVGSGRYLKGWYNNIEPKMYVSKGIGTSLYPIRFGARAEMVEIDL